MPPAGQQQQQSQQAPLFSFHHTDPKVQHTVRCCSNVTLDPCDRAERWMDLVKHGTLPLTPTTADGNLEVDLVHQQQQQHEEGMMMMAMATATRAAAAAAIEALPLPMLAGTSSSTSIDACMFPNMFSGADSGVSCPQYMLTPLAPATADHFRRLGVPSRIYGCQSALDPSQPGQLTFQMVPPNGQQQQQPQQSESQQPQPQRAAFAIINVSHFNFVSRLN